ncbi:hypothetical protein Hypma_012613 [Hypsizygus marmoreus]|uniref:Uncharacterized protein n=1 Tax=Hypsizygus marmoreus TaxID=39966 RepID=A0A369JNF7_HYPMA|nr:hypothetical protein Hypma_012613 [Hypsizygus marmoreus]
MSVSLYSVFVFVSMPSACRQYEAFILTARMLGFAGHVTFTSSPILCPQAYDYDLMFSRRNLCFRVHECASSHVQQEFIKSLKTSARN